MAVLYRKYRPQTFAEVIGQKYIIQTLKNQVLSGAVSHAYLFTGSRGVGKTSVARILAKAVNCLNQQKGDACGKCAVCAQIEQGNFLDLIEIDAASNTGVDNIRDLIEHVKFSPSFGKFKVFIIDEVHMLSKGAFNALLKTLEEPPAHAIFILATTEINKVPATIVSRTQRFDFKALSAGDLEQHLAKILKNEKLKLHKEIISLIATNAQGSGRDALSLLDKVLTLGEDATADDCRQLLGITDIALCQNLLALIAAGKTVQIPDFFSSLVGKGIDFAVFNRDFLEYLRSALVSKVTQNQEALAAAPEAEISQLPAALTAADLIFITRLFLKSYKELASSPSPEIPLLLAALEGAFKKSEAFKPLAPAEPAMAGENSTEAKLLKSSLEVNPAPNITITEIAVTNTLSAVSVAQNQLAESSQDFAQGVTFEQVREFWPKVTENIKKINGPLASLIKTSPLEGLSEGRVVLRVRFQFDKQNIENPKNRGVICQAIEQAGGKKLGILARVVKAEPQPKVNASEALTDALKIFGGELIE